MGSKSIYSLVNDIYSFVGDDNVSISSLVTSDIGTNIANAIQQSLSRQERRHLRLSGLGPSCPKALWHRINTPHLAEPLPPYARIKYTYGHIIEHLVIGLARAAGHEVTGEQDELTVDGVVGHRDCVIDGAIVDVKSSSSRGFTKFKDKTLAENDDFGYLDQLDAYLVGSADDPLVTVKDRAYIIAVDKTLGHMCLYEHRIRHGHIEDRISNYKRIVSASEPPRCECGIIADGESGNLKLDIPASYSPFRRVCHPNVRTFLYAGGPRYLTKVVRTPTYKGALIPELTRTFH